MNGGKNNAIALPALLVLVWLLTIGDVHDLSGWLPGGGSQHQTVAAFTDSLSSDLADIAKAVKEQGPEKTDLMQSLDSAFDRASTEAKASINKEIQNIDDDDFNGLAKLLDRLAKELK